MTAISRASLRSLGRQSFVTDRDPVTLRAARPQLGKSAEGIKPGSTPSESRSLTYAMLVVTACEEVCSNMEFLVSRQRLFGAVASDSTLYRAMRAIVARRRSATVGSQGTS
ncbi:MAG TPA: hypothetical protein DCQ04_10185 [Actinobacteria bacterium]|nr:hypothetical protein [Actinomycetota bacterium]